MKERICLLDADAYCESPQRTGIYEDLRPYLQGIVCLLNLLMKNKRVREIEGIVEYIKVEIISFMSLHDLYQKRLVFFFLQHFTRRLLHIEFSNLNKIGKYELKYYNGLKCLLKYNYDYSSTPLNFTYVEIHHFFSGLNRI